MRFHPIGLMGLPPVVSTAYLVGWYDVRGKFLGRMEIYSEPSPTCHLSMRPRVLAKASSSRGYDVAKKKLQRRMLRQLLRKGM